MSAKRTQAFARAYVFPQTLAGLASSKRFYRPAPDTLLENQIITISKFFTPDVCDELIASFVASPHLKLETTPLRKSKEYAVRVNDRASTTDPEVALHLWAYLSLLLALKYEDDNVSQIFSGAIGLNPQLRVYRYREGHHFGQHYDESVEASVSGARGRTGWTVLIYLTGEGEFSGGETTFHLPRTKGAVLTVRPTKGMVLLHKHGDDCLLHEGERVTAGEKWVLRTDVVFPN